MTTWNQNRITERAAAARALRARAMGVPLWKGALFAALLAYHTSSLLAALRARANAFLSPVGVGASEAALVTLREQHAPAHASLRFTADLHASPLLSSRDFLARASRKRRF